MARSNKSFGKLLCSQKLPTANDVVKDNADLRGFIGTALLDKLSLRIHDHLERPLPIFLRVVDNTLFGYPKVTLHSIELGCWTEQVHRVETVLKEPIIGQQSPAQVCFSRTRGSTENH